MVHGTIAALSIAPFTVHFEIKEIKKNSKDLLQNTSNYDIYFLRVSSGATYYERGIESQINAPVVYKTTIIVTTVMFCNQIMTRHKKINLSY